MGLARRPIAAAVVALSLTALGLLVARLRAGEPDPPACCLENYSLHASHEVLYEPKEGKPYTVTLGARGPVEISPPGGCNLGPTTFHGSGGADSDVCVNDHNPLEYTISPVPITLTPEWSGTAQGEVDPDDPWVFNYQPSYAEGDWTLTLTVRDGGTCNADDPDPSHAVTVSFRRLLHAIQEAYLESTYECGGGSCEMTSDVTMEYSYRYCCQGIKSIFLDLAEFDPSGPFLNSCGEGLITYDVVVLDEGERMCSSTTPLTVLVAAVIFCPDGSDYIAGTATFELNIIGG